MKFVYAVQSKDIALVMVISLIMNRPLFIRFIVLQSALFDGTTGFHKVDSRDVVLCRVQPRT